MTAVCGGGASRPKNDVDPLQVLIGDQIGDILVSLGMPEFAAVYASVAFLKFGLDAVCTVDPPAIPTIDAARIAAYYDSFASDAYPLILKDAQDLIGHYLWFQWCECVTAPQPTPPAPTPFPPGVSIDDPRLVLTPFTECYSFLQSFEGKTSDANGDITWDLTAGAPGTIGASTQWFSTFISNHGGTQLPPYPIVNYVDQLDAAGHLVDSFSTTYAADPPNTAAGTFSIPRNSSATTLRFRSHLLPGSSGQNVQSLFTAHQVCSDLPPSARPDCCPPDPTLEGLIVQVLRLERLILDSLGGNTSYSRGTAHLGLTGSGSLAVAGLRGVAVEVTTGTPTTPLLPGNPPYQWDLGWMSVLTGDGMIEERRLTRQHQVWLPASMSLTTTFGYFLNPGVVATITELVPA